MDARSLALAHLNGCTKEGGGEGGNVLITPTSAVWRAPFVRAALTWTDRLAPGTTEEAAGLFAGLVGRTRVGETGTWPET